MALNSKVFPGSRNLAPDCVVIDITTRESGASLREPGKTLLNSE